MFNWAKKDLVTSGNNIRWYESFQRQQQSLPNEKPSSNLYDITSIDPNSLIFYIIQFGSSSWYQYTACALQKYVKEVNS